MRQADPLGEVSLGKTAVLLQACQDFEVNSINIIHMTYHMNENWLKIANLRCVFNAVSELF